METNKRNFRSRKEAVEYLKSKGVDTSKMTIIDWLKINQGQGEIHISLLAEAMWDSLHESEPKQLKAGEWHIPFGDKFDEEYLAKASGFNSSDYDWYIKKLWTKIQVATARCARVSYLNFEGKDDYEADIKLYNRLLESGHYSPFEHCARAMSKKEMVTNVSGELETMELCEDNEIAYLKTDISERNVGWSGNFRGFVQLRKEIE